MHWDAICVIASGCISLICSAAFDLRFMRIKIADENRDLIEVLQVEQFHLLTYGMPLTVGRCLPSQTGGRLFQINVMKIDVSGKSQFATNPRASAFATRAPVEPENEPAMISHGPSLSVSS